MEQGCVMNQGVVDGGDAVFQGPELKKCFPEQALRPTICGLRSCRSTLLVPNAGTRSTSQIEYAGF